MKIPNNPWKLLQIGFEALRKMDRKEYVDPMSRKVLDVLARGTFGWPNDDPVLQFIDKFHEEKPNTITMSLENALLEDALSWDETFDVTITFGAGVLRHVGPGIPDPLKPFEKHLREVEDIVVYWEVA
jgi:hypothetical protein